MSIAFELGYIDSQRLQSYVYLLYYLWLWLSRFLDRFHFLNFWGYYGGWDWRWFDFLSLDDRCRNFLNFLFFRLAGRRVRENIRLITFVRAHLYCVRLL